MSLSETYKRNCFSEKDDCFGLFFFDVSFDFEKIMKP